MEMRYKLGPFAVPHVAQQGHASEPEELELRNIVGTDAAECHDLFVDKTTQTGVLQLFGSEVRAVTLLGDAVVDGTQENIIARRLPLLHLLQ